MTEPKSVHERTDNLELDMEDLDKVAGGSGTPVQTTAGPSGGGGKLPNSTAQPGGNTTTIDGGSSKPSGNPFFPGRP